MFISTGVLVLAVALGFKLWRQNATWPGFIITFIAGVMLAGSAIGGLARVAGTNGVQIGNTVVTSVGNGIAGGGGSSSTPAKKPATTARQGGNG